MGFSGFFIFVFYGALMLELMISLGLVADILTILNAVFEISTYEMYPIFAITALSSISASSPKSPTHNYSA
jgi:hypothetical protein